MSNTLKIYFGSQKRDLCDKSNERDDKTKEGSFQC